MTFIHHICCNSNARTFMRGGISVGVGVNVGVASAAAFLNPNMPLQFHAKSSNSYNIILRSPLHSSTSTKSTVNDDATEQTKASSSSSNSSNSSNSNNNSGATHKRDKKGTRKTPQLQPPMPPSSFPDWAYEPRDFFRYELIYQSKKSNARVGRIHTPHGIIDTPGYVAVATNGALKGLDMRDADAAGQQLVFCNSYHLLLQPGPELIEGTCIIVVVVVVVVIVVIFSLFPCFCACFFYK